MEGKRSLSQASVNIHSGAGRETYIQYIDEKIQSLKKENESSAMNYEQKEEFLANNLSGKLMRLRREKFHFDVEIFLFFYCWPQNYLGSMVR